MALLRAAFVIARRDFTATVFSRAFLLFLLGPLFPVIMAGVFGSIGGTAMSQAERPVVAVVSTDADYSALATARARLNALAPQEGPRAFKLSLNDFLKTMVKINENIRGSDIFLFQPTFAPANNLMELLVMLDSFPPDPSLIPAPQRSARLPSRSGPRWSCP